MRPFAILSVFALTAACGTTVPAGLQSGAVAGADGQVAGGLATGSEATRPGEVVRGGGRSTGPVRADGAGIRREGSADGAGAGTAPKGGPGAAADLGGSGQGFSKDRILIGVGTASDSDAFASSVGVSGTSGGDQRAQMKAVADDINRHGGVLGRSLVLVPHGYSTTQTVSDPVAANAAACATWTQDNHVFAVLMPLVVEDTLLSCLARTHTPLLNVGGGVDYPLHYASTYAKYPGFFNLAQMVGDRYDRIAVARLKARGFFTAWDTAQGQPGTAPVRVGLVGFDDADGALQIASQRKQLAANGVRVEGGNVIRCPRALAASVNCYQGAVLRFRSAGVTHVFGVALLFMNQAESQGYRPRYFVANSARVLAENAPAEQLEGAMAESYIPSYDVETSEYPGDPSSQTADCRRIMKAAGIDISQPGVLFNALMVCDAFFHLRAGIVAAGALGAEALVHGLESLGGRQGSTLTWSSYLAPGDHTSAHVLRDLTYRKDRQRWFYDDRTNRS